MNITPIGSAPNFKSVDLIVPQYYEILDAVNKKYTDFDRTANDNTVAYYSRSGEDAFPVYMGDLRCKAINDLRNIAAAYTYCADMLEDEGISRL